MPRDYYDTLGVDRSASADEIKSAYRKLAREYHPDRNPGDKAANAKFQEIQEAYDILSDTEKRSRYDQFGFHDPAGFGGFGGGAGGFPEGGQTMDIEDLLRQFTGGGAGMGDFFARQAQARRSGGARRPAPVTEHEIQIPFMTMATGGSVDLRVGNRTLEVTVPAGATDGKKLRLAGQGAGGGDIIVILRMLPHPYFKMEEKDVILEVPLTVAEAVLGTKVDVPTVKGDNLSVTIKPGTASGARRRLPGFGIAGGDQYLEIKIVTPTEIDDKSRELIEEFAKLNPMQPRENLPWAKGV